MIQPHILCDSKDISKFVILPGDPARVFKVAKYLENVVELVYNREYRTIVGEYKGVPITVTSTGIGAPSACIAIEELYACGAEYFIRIGSTGAIQEEIKIGDLVIATAAVRNDGASVSYVENGYPAVSDLSVTKAILESCEENYIKHHCGIIRSHDSFYTENEEEISDYWSKKNVLSADMESAIIFTLANLKGIKAGAVLNTVVEYKADVKNGISEYVNEEKMVITGEQNEIFVALEAMYKLSKKISNIEVTNC